MPREAAREERPRLRGYVVYVAGFAAWTPRPRWHLVEMVEDARSASPIYIYVYTHVCIIYVYERREPMEENEK